MKHKSLLSMLCLSVGWMVSAAWACPDAKTAAAEETKAKSSCCGGCGSKAVAVADKAEDKTTVSEKAPCAKSAAAVADKAPCAKSKSTTPVAEKAPCTKSAVTVAEKAPCSGKAEKTASAEAQPCSKPCDKPCAKAAKLTADGEGGCPIGKKVDAILASFPKVTYRIGDERTCCAKGAAAMAEKSGKPIEYVVGDETFASEGEAKARLVALLDKEVDSLTTIQFVADGKCMRCPVTAKKVAQEKNAKVLYRVGGVDFETREAAEKALKAVQDAVSGVKLAFKVEGKTYQCGKTAGEKANGKGMVFVVGDTETPCETTAKLLLEEAKIRKIVETAVATSFSS